jgi:hypothetical protein
MLSLFPLHPYFINLKEKLNFSMKISEAFYLYCKVKLFSYQEVIICQFLFEGDRKNYSWRVKLMSLKFMQISVYIKIEKYFSMKKLSILYVKFCSWILVIFECCLKFPFLHFVFRNNFILFEPKNWLKKWNETHFSKNIYIAMSSKKLQQRW